MTRAFLHDLAVLLFCGAVVVAIVAAWCFDTMPFLNPGSN